MRCCAATINAQGARIRDRRIGIGTHAGAAGPLTDIANSVRTRLPHSSRNDSPTHAHSHPDERAVQPEERAMALSQSEAGVRPPRPLRSLHGRPLHHQANRTRTTDHRGTGTETAALTTPPSGTCAGEPSTPAQDRAPDLTRGPARLEHPPGTRVATHRPGFGFSAGGHGHPNRGGWRSTADRSCRAHVRRDEWDQNYAQDRVLAGSARPRQFCWQRTFAPANSQVLGTGCRTG